MTGLYSMRKNKLNTQKFRIMYTVYVLYHENKNHICLTHSKFARVSTMIVYERGHGQNLYCDLHVNE